MLVQAANKFFADGLDFSMQQLKTLEANPEFLTEVIPFHFLVLCWEKAPALLHGALQ